MKTNYLIKITFLLFIALFAFSCADKIESPLILTTKEHQLSSEETTLNLPIKNDPDITVSIDERIDWLTYEIEPKNNQMFLIITCSENEDITARKAELLVSSNGSTEIITIFQEAAGAIIPTISSFALEITKNDDLMGEDLYAQIHENEIRFSFDYTPSNFSFSPTIEANCAGIFFVVDSDTIAYQNQKIDFSKDVKCILKNMSGKTNIYTVHISAHNTIPVVYIETDNYQPIVSKENYLSGSLTLDGLGIVPSLEASMKIRGRGNSTWGFPKKPYRIKFDKKQELAGFPAHKDWVLLANYIDESLMKNSVAFQIARIMELGWCSRSIPVDVYINGVYQGNYLLCEQIKIDENRLNIAKLKNDDVSEDKITGGYLLEMDTHFDEEQKFKSAIRQLPVMIKDPELNDRQFDWIQSHFNTTERVIYSDDYLNAETGYRNYIDTESFIKWWLLYELMTNDEPGHPKSCYMYKDRNDKFKMGPIWDFDWYTVCGTTEGWSNSKHLWYDRLFQDSEYVSQTKSIWNRYKADLQNEIQIYLSVKEQELGLSAALNHKLWPRVNEKPDSFEVAIEKLKTHFQQRIQWMDQAINSL